MRSDWGQLGIISDCGLLEENLVDARQGGGTALENVDDPSERDHRPRELHHVSVESDEVAGGHAAEDYLASTEPEHDHDGNAEHEFERGPEHSHQANEFQAAADVLLIGIFKGRYFRFFLYIGPNHTRAREIFLSSGRDVGKHGLNTLETLVNPAPKVLNDDAGNGQRQEGKECQLGADPEHVEQRKCREDDGVGRIHDRRTQEVTNRAEIIRRLGHDVARAIALVEAIRKPLQMREQIVAQIELDVTGNANHDPASQELKDALGNEDGDNQRSVKEEFVAGDAGVNKVVGRAAENEWIANRDAVSQQDAKPAQYKTAPVALQIGDERA